MENEHSKTIFNEDKPSQICNGGGGDDVQQLQNPNDSL